MSDVLSQKAPEKIPKAIETMKDEEFEAWRDRNLKLVNEALRNFTSDIVKDETINRPEISKLVEAVEYTLLGGGKRLRALIALAACEAAGGKEGQGLSAAMAVEMIHAYSLIHDDLPDLDNDTMRRGRPSNHVVFGADTAILAGDALQAMAFQALLSPKAEIAAEIPDIHKRMLNSAWLLALSCGVQGLVGGQYLDLRLEGAIAKSKPAASQPAPSERQSPSGASQPADDSNQPISINDLIPKVSNMETRKTGSLIAAAMACGAVLGASDYDRDDLVSTMMTIGNLAGLAFQIRDDILNVSGDPALMGKNVGTAAARGKASVPALIGPEKSELTIRGLLEDCLRLAKPFSSPKLERLLLQMAKRDR